MAEGDACAKSGEPRRDVRRSAGSGRRGWGIVARQRAQPSRAQEREVVVHTYAAPGWAILGDLAKHLVDVGYRLARPGLTGDHVGDFVAELKARRRNRDHVRHTDDRLRRLAKDCGWNLPRDATADGFAKWRTGQTELSAKTLNEYLAHANAFFNWLIRNGRAAHNRLKSLLKLPKAPTFERRALSFEEFVRFLRGSEKRRLAYFVASCNRAADVAGGAQP